MLNDTLIKRTLASGLAIAAVGFPASAQAMFIDGGGAASAPTAAVPARPAASVSDAKSGFQWGDAGIGAAGATMLLGVGALGAGVTSRRRRRVVG